MQKVFVSYAWESEEHQERVASFVNYLRKNGVDANFDLKEMQNQTAIHFNEMISTQLSQSDKIILVLTPQYKEKADNFKGGVGAEFRYIISDIDKNPQKYILVSFSELSLERIDGISPDYIKGREIVDLFKDSKDEYRTLFSKILNVDKIAIEDVGIPINIVPKKIPSFELVKESILEKDDIQLYNESTPFFAHRFAKAFPGVRGVRWFDDPVTAIKRLELLLKKPLKGKEVGDPIWYFRGSSCLNISKFSVLDTDKCLIDVEECKIKRIAAYGGSSYFRNFVYVELMAEPPTGVYGFTTVEYIERVLLSRGYACEEYGLYNNTPITRAEFDDGAAEIDGDVVDVSGKAALRVRYLTPYNFVICAKFHPFNSKEGDELTKECLDGLLEGTMNFEEFTKRSECLPRHSKDI